MNTGAPITRVDRIALTDTQKEARTQILYIMADAINALMAAGTPYTKIEVPAQQAAMMPSQQPQGGQ